MNSIRKISGIVAEKDENSVITECNEVFLEYAGISSKDKILGCCTDYDLPWAEYADFYRAHELDAIAGNNYSAIIPFKDHKENYFLFLHTKIQKLDKNGNTSGILCHAVEIMNPDVYRLIDMLSKNTHVEKNIFCLGKKTEKVSLSKRQEEVLFYLVRGKSAKLTAKIMGISFRTVEHYIDILKNKLNCQTKAELIEYALNNGFAGNLNREEDFLRLIDKLKAA